MEKPHGKYDDLFTEHINEGKKYNQYLAQFNIHMPKLDSFEKMRRYKKKNPN